MASSHSSGGILLVTQTINHGLPFSSVHYLSNLLLSFTFPYINWPITESENRSAPARHVQPAAFPDDPDQFFLTEHSSGSNCVSTNLGNCPPGNFRSLSNSTRVGVLIPAFRRRCVSSGKIGAVTPNPRRFTPEPPKFAIAPVTGLRGSEILGRGRPCRGHLYLAPFGGWNRYRSSWPRAASPGAMAPGFFPDVLTRSILLLVDLSGQI